jgi:HK97 family phage portal protein
MGFWDKILSTFGRSRLSEMVTQYNMNRPVYPDSKNTSYLAGYTGNGNVFSVINKITEPASKVRIEQVDIEGNPKPGKSLELLKSPNPYMSQSEYIEAALSFYLIFGNSYTAGERPEYGLRAGKITRLDVLPPQWVDIIVGDFFNPIKGYQLEEGGMDRTYDFTEVCHVKDFNPDYKQDGSHLYGMSRLRPLLQAMTANTSAYDSMVSAFQNQGAYGVLTILGVRDNDGKYNDKVTTKEQLSKLGQDWARKYKGDSNRGELAVTNKSVEWTPFGLSVQDMSVLESIPISRGVICDAYNVPDILFAGSEGRTYDNFTEALKSLWQLAIMPNLDTFLEKLSAWLMPQMGEEGTYFRACYDEIAVLQEDIGKKVEWMVKAGLTFNEIREAVGYEPLPFPNMDVPMISFGMVPISEVGEMPEAEDTEKMLKRIGLEDYRK